MAAALIGAPVAHHDHRELAGELSNLLRARDVADHLDLCPHLNVTYDLLPHDELTMTVEGAEARVVDFVSRCRADGVRIRAVREDDESEFRLVANPPEGPEDLALPDEPAVPQKAPAEIPPADEIENNGHFAHAIWEAVARALPDGFRARGGSGTLLPGGGYCDWHHVEGLGEIEIRARLDSEPGRL